MLVTQVGHVVQRDSIDHQQQWQNHLEQFRASRDAGFDIYCWGHHYLIDPFQHFQPWPVLARLAAEPGNMQLATSVLLLPLLNPVDVAEQAATLDHIAEGRPTCMGGHSMEYVETDPEKGHLFRCPADGCSLKETVQFTRHCDHEHYEKPEGRLLRIVGLLPRCSDEWKAEYKKQPIEERYFSSAKHSRLLDTHRYLNGQKVSLHGVLSTLAYLATALAHLKADDYAHMRHMRIKLPKARRREPEQPPGRSCRDPGCTCCGRWSDVA